MYGTAKQWQNVMEKSLQTVVKSGDIDNFSKLCKLEDQVAWFLKGDASCDR